MSQKLIKYKLIKKYPGSSELGTIFQIYQNYKGDYANYPEFWEKVVEKDYEILSYDGINPLGDYGNIHSVKRLSDGEIFTIGDKFKHNFTADSDKLAKIIKFELTNTQVEVHFQRGGDPYNLSQTLKSLIKYKQPLFTTEDGVDIFKGDFATAVEITYLTLCVTIPYNTGESIKYGNYKYFSTKEKAQEYIILNKPCLSIKDLIDVKASVYSFDAKMCLKSLKELVKFKLNV